jgi:hypothetical protein
MASILDSSRVGSYNSIKAGCTVASGLHHLTADSLSRRASAMEKRPLANDTRSASHACQTSEAPVGRNALRLNDSGYLETRGLNVLVFSNCYDGLFSDAKIAGVELIHHEVRTATNGDVRLSATPGQWDPVSRLIDRKLCTEDNSIKAFLEYPLHNLR